MVEDHLVSTFSLFMVLSKDSFDYINTSPPTRALTSASGNMSAVTSQSVTTSTLSARGRRNVKYQLKYSTEGRQKICLEKVCLNCMAGAREVGENKDTFPEFLGL